MPTQWRIMGMWRDGARFLIVMGKTARDCLGRVDDALADLDYCDVQRLECMWFERWDPGTMFREPSWIPVKDIPLRRLKLVKAAAAAKSTVAGVSSTSGYAA